MWLQLRRRGLPPLHGPNVDEAYVRFSIGIRGGLSEKEKLNILQLEEMRRGMKRGTLMNDGLISRDLRACNAVVISEAKVNGTMDGGIMGIMEGFSGQSAAATPLL